MTELKTGTWVLVADGEKALFLENVGDADFPNFEVRRKDEHVNPPTHEQGTDRPGRFNDGPSVSRSAVGDTDWHRLERDRFAHDLADLLYRMAHRHRFERLVVVTGPQILGQLREAFHKEVRDRIVAEIPKNLGHEPLDRLEEHVKAALSGSA